MIENDADWYRMRTVPAFVNLTKKWDKGTFNIDLARKMMRNQAREYRQHINARRTHTRSLKTYDGSYVGVFSTSDADAVGNEMADYWHEELKVGNRMEPKKPRVSIRCLTCGDTLETEQSNCKCG